MTFDDRLELLRQRHRLIQAGIVKPPKERERLARAVRRQQQRIARPASTRAPGKRYGRAWESEMQAQRRCQSCGGSPLTTKQYCEPCRLRVNARTAARRLKSGAVPKPPQRCTVCDETGHNAARHRFVDIPVTP